MQLQRVIVKLGTSTLTGGGNRLNHQRMLEIVQQIAYLHQQGHEILIVSSGAQAAGRECVNVAEGARSMPTKQMFSAIGQSRLMRVYNDLFDIFGIIVAQVLLTGEDLSKRLGYLNARDTLQTLLEHRVIPIINENDTVATEEIRVGDNDNLSAKVASAVEGDLLIMLTDQAGLYSADPRKDPKAELIPVVKRIDKRILDLAGGAGTKGGTGGMITKLQAAQTSTRSGVTTVIAKGTEPRVLERIVAGEALGTRFEATSTHLESRKRWLLTDKPHGTLRIDAGALKALLAKEGASLLPVGIKALDGNFSRSATVAIVDAEGKAVAHGLSNYTSDELRQVLGRKSSEIADILGYSYGDAAVHRNNLVLLGEE